MASTSVNPTESAVVPFNLLNSPFPVLRNFLDIIPLRDLYYLRQIGANVRSLSQFRGEIVLGLEILTDTVKPWHADQKSYSEFMNRPTPIKPYGCLKVMMGPDVNPEALLAKIEEQQYCCLSVSGKYHWKDMVAFLYPGVSSLCLYDSMDLPEEDVEKFFHILIDYKVDSVQFCDENSKETWFNAAHKKWTSLIGTVLKTVEVEERFNSYLEQTATRTDGVTIKLIMKLQIDEEDEEEFFDDDQDQQFFDEEEDQEFIEDELDDNEHIDDDE